MPEVGGFAECFDHPLFQGFHQIALINRRAFLAGDKRPGGVKAVGRESAIVSLLKIPSSFPGRFACLESLEDRHLRELRIAADDDRIWQHTIAAAHGSRFDDWFEEARNQFHLTGCGMIDKNWRNVLEALSARQAR